MSETINTYNPATGEKIDHYHLMSAEDAEQAVTRSQEAYLNWRRTSFETRADLFKNLANLMEELLTLNHASRQSVYEVALTLAMTKFHFPDLYTD